jgi:hypothetical protein
MHAAQQDVLNNKQITHVLNPYNKCRMYELSTNPFHSPHFPRPTLENRILWKTLKYPGTDVETETMPSGVLRQTDSHAQQFTSVTCCHGHVHHV